MPASTPSRIVFLASGLMRSTSASPASMSTPASLYERGEGLMGVRERALQSAPIEFAGFYRRPPPEPPSAAPLHVLHSDPETSRRVDPDRAAGAGATARAGAGPDPV